MKNAVYLFIIAIAFIVVVLVFRNYSTRSRFVLERSLADNPLQEKAYIIPMHLNLGKVNNVEAAQQLADTLAWRIFIAINWPVKGNGEIDTARYIGDHRSKDVIWEKWREISSLLQRKNERFINLNTAKIFLPLVFWKSFNSFKPLRPLPSLLLHQTKQEEYRGLTLTQGDQPLIDQNGNPTFYQSYYNTDMVNYIKRTGLYNIDSAEKYQGRWYKEMRKSAALGRFDPERIAYDTLPLHRIYFPFFNTIPKSMSPYKDKARTIPNDNALYVGKNEKGSVMIKVAWKILSGKDKLADFYSKEALIVTKDTTYTAMVGLVAMHVVIKYAELPQRLWCSFEHVRNVPEKNGAGSVETNGKMIYNYFNSKSLTAVNKRPDNAKEPAQLVREIRLSDQLKKINEFYQHKLETFQNNSVWKNYMLVGTQWSGNPQVIINDLYEGDPQPLVFSNAVIEGFSQNSSCINCHADAKIDVSGKTYYTDFVKGIERISRRAEIASKR